MSNNVVRHPNGAFEYLASIAEFEKVLVADSVVTWPGELDLATDAMHAEIQCNREWVPN